MKQPGQVALLNGGFDGIPVREGEKYDLSVFAKQLEGKGGKIRVSLVQDGRVMAQTILKAPKSDWKKMTAVLKADADADHASIKVEPLGTGKGGFGHDFAFPATDVQREKERFAGRFGSGVGRLKPKSCASLAACVAHGDGLHNIYNWKGDDWTVGSPQNLNATCGATIRRKAWGIMSTSNSARISGASRFRCWQPV